MPLRAIIFIMLDIFGIPPPKPGNPPGAPPKRQRLGNLQQIVAHQQDVGALQRHIGAGHAHRNSQPRRGQGGRIVDAVADHRHRAIAGLDLADQAGFVVGQQLGVHLIDAVAKKKYLVVRDSKKTCDCNRGVKDVTARSRVNLWARFPAPSDNVDKITVIVPHFSPMDDVAISG